MARTTFTYSAGGRRFAVVGMALLVVLGPATAPQVQAQLPANRARGPVDTDIPGTEAAHLQVARRLVQDLRYGARINQYGSDPTFLRWGSPTREARTVCGSFVTHLLEHSYGWKPQAIRRWLGAAGTDATEWHEAIAQENGFRRLRSIADIRPGDILAIKYNDGSKDTGHVMVVDQLPERMPATAPVEHGTEQYRVKVIDSSASGHGPTDSRHKPQGGFTGGIGEGEIRLYTDPAGSIVGYAWSETAQSRFYQSPERDLVAGRLKRDQIAATSAVREIACCVFPERLP